MGNKPVKNPSQPRQTFLDTVPIDSIMERAGSALEEGNTAMINKEYRQAYIAYRYSSALFQLCLQHEAFPKKLKKKLHGYNLSLQYKLQDLQILLNVERDKKTFSDQGKKKHPSLTKQSLKLPRHVVQELSRPQKDSNNMSEEASAYKRILDNLEICVPNVPMSEVIGHRATIDMLEDDLVDRHIRPDLFKDSRNTGALLYGPPGNGKTTIATAVATLVAEASEGNMPYFKLDAADIKSKWSGQAEITLKAAFKLAHMNGPSIMFIDEVENMFAKRTEEGNSSGTGLVQCFLTQMSTYKDVFFMAATNCPWYIDEALIRRMCLTYIRMPTKEERLQLINNLFANEDHFLLKKDLDLIAEKTEGYSFDDICKVKVMLDSVVQNITRHSKYFKQTPHIDGYQVCWTPCMEYEEGATEKAYKSLVVKNQPEGLVHPTITLALVEHALTLKCASVEKDTIELNDVFFKNGTTAVRKLKEEKDRAKAKANQG
jgi:SpoVK/Ycf46/Vps4 family AAA+-type ATPase